MNLNKFISKQQLSILKNNCKSEEKKFFIELVEDLKNLIAAMPKTYDQDGLGQNAIAYLHYFYKNNDWYITERDIEREQLQAFGIANLGHGNELGYISIDELIKNNVELDFYFQPVMLKKLIK